MSMIKLVQAEPVAETYLLKYMQESMYEAFHIAELDALVFISGNTFIVFIDDSTTVWTNINHLASDYGIELDLEVYPVDVTMLYTKHYE